MDSNPFTHTGNFVDLLHSQQSISFANYEDISTLSSSQLPSLGTDDVGERRERRTWTPTDDILLISSWLNTSKDPVVFNEKKSGTFWKRVATYFAASPKLQLGRKVVVAMRMMGLKRAHEIFHNNHNKKFTLEHAWKELRNDQKWCEVSSAKNDGSSKKRKCEDTADSSASQPSETKHPAGVKASKARGKKTMREESAMNGFQSMWDIKQKDLEVKERLSKMSILESLIAKKEPLADYEEALKKKLISQDSVTEWNIESGSLVSRCLCLKTVSRSLCFLWSSRGVEQSE
ncbi:PREDICTED: glutathione S-transferase T3-like [Brassica oleracea var. oleracea]|uniref:glutathione S-transferase T3-like n=1 Tax=Brassica oleracea var. oleracea TaxID=109376 RepID=UPI0006A6A132|nr:PREDICTED: glutathione S-transferase T3-like [Brassica oleracea var. oleracea]